MDKLEKLFQEGTIGGMSVKNRLVMASMGIYGATYDGVITDNVIDFYVARSRGGVGLIISGGFFITRECATPHMTGIYDDKFIPGLKRLCDAVHEGGAKIAVQIAHAGIATPLLWMGYDVPDYAEAVGPSAVTCIPTGITPRELSKKEIKEIAEADGEAARRVKEAGADAVEVHAAHGYMIGEFFSQYKNRRTDEYGGSVENRARFACECLEQARKQVGKDYPIIFRFNGSDCFPGGHTLEDSVRMAPMFVEAGADALDVTAGVMETPWWDEAIYVRPNGLLVPMAAEIKKAVNIPVIAVGKIGDPLFAERILQEEKADFIGMARPMLADPDLPNKAKEGRFDEIDRCIFCNNCWGVLLNPEKLKTEGRVLSCTVNPAVFREGNFKITPTPKAKMVMVIGGGIAGMVAATVMAKRGHTVHLYEKTAKLGGQWEIACRQPDKQGNFKVSLDSFMRKLNKSGAVVTLNREVTKELVDQEKPDAVVLATGSVSYDLNIPGVEKGNVVQAIDVFDGKATTGNRVAVIGGRLRGMEVAHLLTQQGKEVCVITMNRLGENGEPLERITFNELRRQLMEDRTTVYELAKAVEIIDDGVYVDFQHELTFIPADTIVLAVGAKADDRLVDELKDRVNEFYVVGDCSKPGYANAAVNAAAEIGRVI